MPRTIPRQGDHVLVMVDAGDGVCWIFCTPEEYAALWEGVDVEVALVFKPEQRER